MTVGERLREARERQKVSLHAIAEKTNISVRFLDAIEKNQFDKLPGGIFTRGFIRSYAVQVGLDPDAAVTQFLSDEPGAREETDDGPVGNRAGLGIALMLAAGVVGVGLVLGLVYLFAPDWLDLRSAAPVAPPATAAMTAPVDASAGEPASSPSSSAVQPSAPTAGSLSSAGTPPAMPEVAAADAPKAPLHLVLQPSGTCWVQVSADGQMRVARELAAGETVTIEAAERLQIVVGDAGSLAYQLNGRPGKPLGAAGRVARATIVPATVSQFQAP